MAALHSVAVRTSITVTTAASLELRTGASSRARLMELSIFLNAGTQTVLGLGRPQAIGVIPYNPVPIQRDDTYESPPVAQIATAWLTGPTVPLNFFRRVNTVATTGAGLFLTFPRGIPLAANGSLVLWNIAAAPLYDCHVTVDE